MRRHFLLLVLLITKAALAAETSLSLVPVPSQVQEKAGAPCVLRNGTSLRFAHKSDDEYWVADYFKSLVQATVKDLPFNVAADRGDSGVVFDLDAGRSDDESYRIDISERSIRISASSRGGLLYGAITLWQLLSSQHPVAGVYTLPAMTIEDRPEFRWRSLLLDSARHFQPPSFIHRLIDLMALHKLNTLHWHLVDDEAWRIEIKKYPKLIEVGSHLDDPHLHKPNSGFYTQEEIRAIVRYAEERNVTIVPEFEIPGHSSAAIESYPEIGTKKGSEVAGIMRPFEPTFTFIHDVLDEIFVLFPNSPIHIGGDEAEFKAWKENPEVQALERKLGFSSEQQLEDWLMADVVRYIESRGRKAVGYYFPGSTPILPSETIAIYLPENPTRQLLQRGFDIVNMTWPQLYLDSAQEKHSKRKTQDDPNLLKQVYAFDPIPEGVTPKEREHLIGVEGSLWTEWIDVPADVEMMAFPREIAIAELAWSPKEKRNWPDFLRRLAGEYESLHNLGYHPSDIPFAPTLLSRPVQGKIELRSGTQTGYGIIRFTVDGSEPTSASQRLPARKLFPHGTRLKAATFAPDGAKISRTLSKRL